MKATLQTTRPRASATGQPETLRDYLRDYVARLRGGEMGALPAVIMLVFLCTFFGIARPPFLTALNFANLFTQGAAVTVIAMGLVFVLLLGEIDLSAGFASGVCASVLAVLLVNHQWPWYAAIGAAIVTGACIGLVLGVLVAKLGIPSFVVTLAAFLAFQGIALLLIDNGTNISITDKAILLIDSSGKVVPWIGWTLCTVVITAFTALQVMRRRSRVRRGLQAVPPSVITIRVLTLAGLLGASVYALNLDRSVNPLLASQRGIPFIVVIVGVLFVFWTFVLNRTAYGRHVYAVGGNREAARRAGINVDRIRISVFVICSTMAAVGGIIAASRDNSVDPNTGGSNVLLYAVGAAVIGGTSLFGGKGRIIDAVLGGAVVAVINNGMGLMMYSPGQKFIVTGSVLLLAATIDAISRRRASAAGLR
ncbi:MAG: ABC transporter permease [Micromonosporaceae bacterium]|nr:ABC transporter permease [Micromonosporaceae bacterium]